MSRPEAMGRTTSDTLSVHRRSLFLRKLPTSDLRRIAPYLRIRTFARDELVRNDGDVISQVVFPHNMILALLCVMQDGTTIESATVGTEGYVGVEVC